MGWRRTRLHHSPIRRVFVQGIVNPVLMMIGDVFADEPAQMGFIQRDDVIEKFPAATSDPAFGDSAKALGCPSALLSARSLSGNL